MDTAKKNLFSKQTGNCVTGFSWLMFVLSLIFCVVVNVIIYNRVWWNTTDPDSCDNKSSPDAKDPDEPCSYWDDQYGICMKSYVADQDNMLGVKVMECVPQGFMKVWLLGGLSLGLSFIGMVMCCCGLVYDPRALGKNA